MTHKDLDDMTPEEIRAWTVQQRAEATKRFADQPVPRISRAKREDYPHWEQTGWGFRVQSGAAALITAADGSRLQGTTRGLHLAEDQGPLVLLVEVGDETWAMRRRDAGAVWGDHVDAHWCKTNELDVPVQAWLVPQDRTTPGAVVAGPASGAPVHEWVIRTNKLGEDA